MPRLRAVLVALAGFVFLLLLAVWQIPQWLDWTRYRAAIEVLASATLGQPVDISGPISLTLLPQPVLAAAQVNVGGGGPADLSINVKALRLRIALWPLLGGRVDARELVLHEPDLRIPWPTEPSTLRPRPPDWLTAVAARIEDGRLTIGRLTFTGIDASLATLDTGALLATGTGQFSSQDWHFTARLTAAGPDGAAGLNVTLDGQGKANGLGASFTGQLARDGTLAGVIASRGPDLAVLLPTPSVPFRADGRLTVGSGLAVVDNLALEIGGSPATGAVALRVAPKPRLDIAVAASRLGLDAWLPVLLHAGTTVAGIDMPIGIDFSTEAAPLGGGTLEHLRAAFELTGNGLVVREASALLPGNGTLRLGGRVARDDPARPRFEGDATLDAPVLRATLRWLQAAMPGTLPPRLLAELPDAVAQRAALSAHVVAGSGEVALQHLAGTLDDAPIAGSVGLRRGEPPALTADLSFDRLLLDPWLPHQLPGLAGLLGSALGFDAELRLHVRQATLAGTTVNGLAVDAAIEAGSIVLRRLEGVARGAHVTASAMLRDDGTLSGGKLAVEAEDATPLADLVPPDWRATPALWHGPASLTVQLAGPRDALAGEVQLMLADARLDAHPIVNLTSGDWTSTLTLHHPGARRLLASIGVPEQAGLRSVPVWLGDGSLSLVTHLAGGRGRLVAKQFDLTAATLHVTGQLACDLSGTEPRVTGHVDTEEVTLPLPYGDSDVPLPFGVLHGWQADVRVAIGRLAAGAGPALHDVSVNAVVANDGLRLNDLTASLASGTLSGRLAFNATVDPPALEVQAKLNDAVITEPLGDTPIDLLSGHADASVQLTARGYSPSVILATLDGRAAMTAHDGTLSGFDLFRLKQSAAKPDPKSAQAAAGDALRAGTTPFDRLELAGSIAHGDLTLETGSLTGSAGAAHFDGDVNFAARALNLTIGLRPAMPSPPEVAIHLTGSIDQPNRVLELDGLARWMAALVR